MAESKPGAAPLRCPRCGGLMRKPAGSTLYWHADNDHPRCDITNIVETVLEVQAAGASALSPESPQGRLKA
jgi:hypothetical protein